MGMGYVLYNTKAGTHESAEDIRDLEVIMNTSVKYISIHNIKHYNVFLNGLEPDDYLILAGGDGTLNRFVNDIQGLTLHNEILYYPNGTGNDFAHDLGHSKECNPFPITDYLKDLPSVTVNGNTYRFLNGIGFGIDGYCCEVGDELKTVSDKKVNYTAIAVKGLLFHYQPTGARITVDGKTHTYRKVWLAPTMNGRFYGGGMMPTPNQKRNSGLLSTMVFHDTGKLKTLMIFPSLFKGEHIRHTAQVDIWEGQEITVEFDRPTALQIDGETIKNVTSYTAVASAKVTKSSQNTFITV